MKKPNGKFSLQSVNAAIFLVRLRYFYCSVIEIVPFALCNPVNLLWYSMICSLMMFSLPCRRTCHCTLPLSTSYDGALSLPKDKEEGGEKRRENRRRGKGWKSRKIALYNPITFRGGGRPKKWLQKIILDVSLHFTPPSFSYDGALWLWKGGIKKNKMKRNWRRERWKSRKKRSED